MDATSSSTKAYIIAVIIQLIYTGAPLVSKVAFNDGLSTSVFVFYRQAAGSVVLLPLALFLQSNTLCLNMYNLSLKFTSPTVASATNNSMPVLTFCLALLLRMEVVKPRSSSGVAKLAGIALCLGGVLVIAFYAGPAVSPVNHHRAFSPRPGPGHHVMNASSRATWIKGTLLFLIGNLAWSLSIVWQAALLKEYPNRMLVAVAICVFSAAQSFVIAVVAERDLSRWKLQLDISLLAIAYTGFLVSGVTYYLQAWCIEMKGPVFFGVWTPLCFVFTMFCSSLLGEVIHLGSILGGTLLAGGLYSVLWGKSKECTDKIALDGEVNTIAGSHQDEQMREGTSVSLVDQEQSPKV
ncbi:hypothetical protein U9M48_013716 [Paspalum notatum var. saurae]|uniref:WAT1-related protein n=1 Tax=Paspalum notatum var. saurae TaxID=547442 RepID=A0AAQ3WJT4_PASNO